MGQPPGFLGYTRQTHNVCFFVQSQDGVSPLLFLFCLVSLGLPSWHQQANILISSPLLDHFCHMLGGAPFYIISFHLHDCKTQSGRQAACPKINHAAGKRVRTPEFPPTSFQCQRLLFISTLCCFPCLKFSNCLLLLGTSHIAVFSGLFQSKRQLVIFGLTCSDSSFVWSSTTGQHCGV